MLYIACFFLCIKKRKFLGNKFGMSLIPLVVVIGLIGVFKHGYKLQQEVDETL